MRRTSAPSTAQSPSVAYWSVGSSSNWGRICSPPCGPPHSCGVTGSRSRNYRAESTAAQPVSGATLFVGGATYPYRPPSVSGGARRTAQTGGHGARRSQNRWVRTDKLYLDQVIVIARSLTQGTRA